MARAKRFGPYNYEKKLGDRSYDFKATVDDIISTVDARMTAVVRESVSRTIDIAQTVEGKGGKMRIDTGFLRASGQLSLTGMPTGPVRGELTEKNSYTADPTVITLELGKFKLGATLFWVWSADYARVREAYDGFLESAVQKWPQTVATVCEEVKARIK